MAYSLTWLPEELRKAGLKVAETDGWASRGVGEMGQVRGVMCHHTGSQALGNMPTLKTLINGRGGSHPLHGPLAQLGLAVDGTFYVIAAGRANHAGAGEWKGIRTGNSSFIGIEAENAGTPGAFWPDWQMDAYRRGVAAILRYLSESASMCCGHKEYALPAGRKPDPLFDMALFREGVAAIMLGKAAVRTSVPAVEPGAGRPTLFRGSQGKEVRLVQSVVGATADGKFGPTTEAAVRKFQESRGLRPDGVVGPLSWAEIDEVATGPAQPAGNASSGAQSSSSQVGALPGKVQPLLDLIGKAEAPQGHGTIFGNNQGKLPKPLTAMTVQEVIAAGPGWGKRYGSSAAGRYQFLTRTLRGLVDKENLAGTELFDANLQDSLACSLLLARGYARFLHQNLDVVTFGLNLAKEWASCPVLADCRGPHRSVKRGETYYAGDRVNKALIGPEVMEQLLNSL